MKIWCWALRPKWQQTVDEGCSEHAWAETQGTTGPALNIYRTSVSKGPPAALVYVCVCVREAGRPAENTSPSYGQSTIGANKVCCLRAAPGGKYQPDAGT